MRVRQDIWEKNILGSGVGFLCDRFQSPAAAELMSAGEETALIGSPLRENGENLGFGRRTPVFVDCMIAPR